jgi:chemotaxis protein MotB
MSSEPIIIIKKKGGHGGHHGGAWKVAYADFVTAMMSLFIVLWLMSSTSKKTQEGIAGYFRDPQGTAAKRGINAKPGMAETSPAKKPDLAKLKEALQKAIEQSPDLKKLVKQIELTITPEGLRIEMIEDKKGTFFETGSAQPTPVLVELLKLLASQIGSMPNRLSVEGHTDAQPYSPGATYGNWELSADRANVARRLMQANGLKKDQISQVRGFADQRLRKPDQPLDASNRRISLIVQNPNYEDLVPEVSSPFATAPAAVAVAGQVAVGGEKPGTEAKPAEGEKPVAEEALASDGAKPPK